MGFELLVEENSQVLFSSLSPEQLDQVKGVDVSPGDDGMFLLLTDRQMIHQRVFTAPGSDISITIANLSPAGGALVQRMGHLGRGGFSWRLTLLSLIFIALTNGLLAWIISRSIMKPLNKLSSHARDIRDGNLDNPVVYSGKDEFRPVFEDFEEMRARLKESVEIQQQYEEGRKELLAGISHDLSTPLTSIKGYVSGLMDGIADTPEKREKYLQRINSTAGAMDNLVSELFLLSKLDLNRVPFYTEKIDLNSYFRDCVEELQLELEKEGIKVSFKNSCPQPLFVSLDPNQFRRVVQNIIDNSGKYKQGKRGTIKIKLSCESDYALIALEDNGRGVDQGDADRIFESFYRGDPARSNSAKGSGLGLAIARRIIQQQGGTIWAESSLGHGMTIYIKLPRVKGD
jgi:signal transduction histidine kinase